MTQPTLQTRQSERGFTLVELAIVMIIIGLLIGGILKGQELIGNARIASSISQIKAIETGINTFRDKYSGMPGDIGAPNARVPNCTNVCNQAGNGDGQIFTGAVTAAVADNTNENSAAMAQMVAADMMSGVSINAAVGTATSVGGSGAGAENLLASNIAGSFKLGFTNAAAAGTGGSVGALAAGHYVRWDNSIAGAPAAGANSLNQSQAARVDRKMDDGNSGTGSVVAIGNDAAATDCSNAGVYNEADGSAVCGLYVRVAQ